MKQLLIVFLCMQALCSSAQTELRQGIEDHYILVTDTSPKYIHGGNDELLLKLHKSIHLHPQQCTGGTTILEFSVDTLGQVQSPKIRRSVSEYIDEQLIAEILKAEFIPGECNGYKVKSTMVIPFRICLRE